MFSRALTTRLGTHVLQELSRMVAQAAQDFSRSNGAIGLESVDASLIRLWWWGRATVQGSLRGTPTVVGLRKRIAGRAPVWRSAPAGMHRSLSPTAKPPAFRPRELHWVARCVAITLAAHRLRPACGCATQPTRITCSRASWPVTHEAGR
jgi:hypothetical protein